MKSNEPLAYYVSLALLKPIDINYKYLAYNIQSEVTQENIWKKTLHVAFPKKINKNEIEKIKISTPEFTEQEKIGQLFDSIDKMIEVQTNLIEENKKLKKSLLQKMFPKKGEKFPELRLKGFSGEWKEKVLREVLKERKEEDTPSKTFPLVSFTVENGVTPKTERYEREFLVKETDKKYKVTRLNDLVYNPILAVEYIYNHRRIGGI
ncbi:MAG: restriction endonuclease subunit S [Treponema phagedenis]|uniref:hypothetical protein n=1 Tax=Treponema phagedenis TaxID=162 RepID=UPI003133D255